MIKKYVMVLTGEVVYYCISLNRQIIFIHQK